MEHPNDKKPRPAYDIEQPTPASHSPPHLSSAPQPDQQPDRLDSLSERSGSDYPPMGSESSRDPSGRPGERGNGNPHVRGVRGTAAMDPETRQEVARKGGIAVSRNKQHMAEIGRKGGQSVSKNREHMASIGKKGGAASRGGR